MLRKSLIATALAIATIAASAGAGNAETRTHHRTVVHHVYRYAPVPAYYDPYYGNVPYYAPAPVAPIVALPGAAVCLAFALLGAC